MTDPHRQLTFVQRFGTFMTKVLKHNDIAMAVHTPEEFSKVPGVSESGLLATDDLQQNAGAYADDPTRCLTTAKALAGAADTMTGSGALHMVSGRRGHGYIFHTNWLPIPANAVNFLCTLGNFSVFRTLLGCFPTYIGELPKNLPPAAIEFEPDPDPTGSIVVLSDTSAQRLAISQNCTAAWKENRPVGGALWLSLGGIVIGSRYTEIKDETSGLIVRNLCMGTSGWHLFDGYLNWQWTTDYRRGRHMFGVIGGGVHPIHAMDTINPIGGAVIMLTMFQTLQHVLKGYDKGKFTRFQYGQPGAVDLHQQLTADDPQLAHRRELLRAADGPTIGLALARQAIGPNLSDEMNHDPATGLKR